MSKLHSGLWCSAINCSHSKNKNPEKGFFSFPKNDLERCKKWRVNCRRLDLDKKPIEEIAGKFFLCEDHFEASQFMNPNDKGILKLRKRLIHSAVPTIFAFSNPLFSATVKRKLPTLYDYQPKKRPKKTDNEMNLESKLTNIEGEEEPFCAIDLPVHDVRVPQFCCLKEERHKITLGQKGKYSVASLHSLPENLVLRQSILHGDFYGVWSQEDISEGTRFGPYRGVLTNDLGSEQIENNGKKLDDIPFNWLEYVNHAFTKEQQNLIPFQFQEQIFYISCKHIPVNTELLAGYRYERGMMHRNITNGNKVELHKESLTCHDSYGEKFSMQRCLKLQNIIDTKIRMYEYDRCRNDSGLSIYERVHIGRKHDESTVHKQRLPQIINPESNKYLTYGRHGQKYTQFAHLSSPKWLSTGIKPYKCDQCAKQFTKSYYIKIHKRRLHTGEKPYECGNCGKKFAESGCLKSHQKRIHIKEKPYQCDECGKMFVLNVDLKIHKKSHIKEKNYKCEECGKLFAHNILLRRHRKRNHAEKFFQCVACKKRFAVRADLNHHRKFHINEKTNECNQCGKTFTLKSSLNRHKRKKHYKCN